MFPFDSIRNVCIISLHTDDHYDSEEDFHQEIKPTVTLRSLLFVDFILLITNHLYTGLKDKRVAENIKY